MNPPRWNLEMHVERGERNMPPSEGGGNASGYACYHSPHSVSRGTAHPPKRERGLGVSGPLYQALNYNAE